jgi:hypothetical protein
MVRRDRVGIAAYMVERNKMTMKPWMWSVARVLLFFAVGLLIMWALGLLG